MSKIPEDLRLLLFGALASVCVFLPETNNIEINIKFSTLDFGNINTVGDILHVISINIYIYINE